MTDTELKSPDFLGLGIAPKLLDTLEYLKFSTPTPIQLKSIPVTLEGKDLVGIAQTGTGKTLAFGIPLVQRLAISGGKALILLPTRELALQVHESLKTLTKRFDQKTAVLIGGEPKPAQTKLLRQGANIIIATPGRLIDHIQSRGIYLNDVKILVLDEADLMLDMGFIPQVTEILKSVPSQRQTLLFSATMPSAILKIITQYMKLPVKIEVAPSGTLAENITQEVIVINREDRIPQLQKILQKYTSSVLIFAKTKHGVKNLTRKLKNMGFQAAEIHSGRSLNQRSSALKGFKIGQHKILVATDIAARGIDVKGIELVLNFDLPNSSEDYVHRIGRTARAGKNGQAITFASPNEMMSVRKIEQIIKKTIPQTHLAKPLPESYVGRSQNRSRNFNRPKQFKSRSQSNNSSSNFNHNSSEVKNLGNFNRPKKSNHKKSGYNKSSYKKSGYNKSNYNKSTY